MKPVVFGIALFATLALAAGVYVSAQGLRPAGPMTGEIDGVFRSAHADGKFNGNVLVTRGDATLYEASFGAADVQTNAPITTATRFLAFSVVKPMTATLVFQQIEAGKLHLGDALESFFPNLTGKPAGKITLQQLLTHTSGINEVISRHLDRRITAADLETAKINPNAGFDYSSTGYVILGLVLEKSTGAPYENLLRASILDPAGMNDSGLARTGAAIPDLARGYKNEKGKQVEAQMGVALEALDGAGSIYTTARDLWRFDRALAGGKLLPPSAQKSMLSQQTKGRYGYGWFLDEQGGKYFPWHKGDYRGYAAMLVRQVHRDEAIVILSNFEQADVLGLRTKVLRILKANPAP